MTAPAITGSCPKRMIFGPCGGVRPDGGCEMRDAPCGFDDLVRWPGDAPVGPAAPATAIPLVLTDFSVPPLDRAAQAETAAILAPACDAVLVGEHQDRPDFPPSLLARLLLDAGVVPWTTLACRDRNRVVLEQELHGLREAGADTVLCVTGDGRAYDARPDVTQVFDLDGTRLAALAASIGLRAAVAETPTAPPRGIRPHRLVEKQRAGATVAVLNHVDAPTDVTDFLRAARTGGLTMPVIASVVVYTDIVSAAVLAGLPGLHLDAGAVADVVDAPDPVSAGIEAAVTRARALLAIDGIDGVNLSGLASDRGYAFAARVKAEIGARLRAAAAGAT